MKKNRTGSVRIIGGKWRGTRLPVPEISGLRPSGDRGRETLFNWLQVYIHGSRCVDLFAGSGVLGLEAASRGAAEVILVEKSSQAVRVIRESLQRISAENIQIIETDALFWLSRCDPQSIDIVFIDPPFGEGLEVRAIELLAASDSVRSGGIVYIETAREAPKIEPGPGWDSLRDKTLGEVRMQLLKKV